MRVLGIDPGYDRCGLAVAEKNANGKEILLHSECITTNKEESNKRLKKISTRIRSVFVEYKPDVVAIEKLFFSKNQKTALAVAEARGAILSVSAEMNLPVCEYSPQEIKLAVTGYGASSKKQVEDMVRRLVEIHKPVKYDDEFDAIATALTHIATKTHG